jgi:CxxC motif-containing protein (DUF1111 family)
MTLRVQVIKEDFKGGILIKTVKLASVLTLALLFLAGMAIAQTDPGVQGGAARAGLALPSVLANDNTGILSFFNDGLARFQDVETIPTGLGPRFNSNSCSSCHAQPAVGGTGPATNPQFQFISTGVVSGSTNTMPSFLTANGPTREARFPFQFNSNGTVNRNAPNGGVETIFTVSGLSGASACNLQQPSFALAQQEGNIIFRIPTPTFGAGLIENLDDSTLLANQAAQANNGIGISGTFNHNGNDGTISRFGWKAQNKSLHIFAGEAYNVEMGISNLLFTQDRPLPVEDTATGLPAGCLNLSGKGYPEDQSNFNVSPDAAVLDDVSAFANFMRFLAAPSASTTTPGGSASISRGAADFVAVGCSICHTPTPGNTQASSLTGSLSKAPVNAFSDIEIHHMGTGLADNVSQGGAGGDQFRSAPLWGLGQRIFLLHDGRTTNLLTAIEAHNSNGSEASISEELFDNLTASQQQDLLNFLRSL